MPYDQAIVDKLGTPTLAVHIEGHPTYRKIWGPFGHTQNPYKAEHLCDMQ